MPSILNKEHRPKCHSQGNKKAARGGLKGG